MGLEAPTESLLALANRPDDDHDCEWIHKGVNTRPARILAVSAFRNVGYQSHAVVLLHHSPSLFELSDPHQRLTDWSVK